MDTSNLLTDATQPPIASARGSLSAFNQKSQDKVNLPGIVTSGVNTASTVPVGGEPLSWAFLYVQPAIPRPPFNAPQTVKVEPTIEPVLSPSTVFMLDKEGPIIPTNPTTPIGPTNCPSVPTSQLSEISSLGGQSLMLGGSMGPNPVVLPSVPLRSSSLTAFSVS